MFVASVITGRPAQGDPSIVREPEGCNCTVNSMADPTIFVVFHTKQSYPEFLIKFTEKPSSANQAGFIHTPRILHAPLGTFQADLIRSSWWNHRYSQLRRIRMDSTFLKNSDVPFLQGKLTFDPFTGTQVFSGRWALNFKEMNSPTGTTAPCNYAMTTTANQFPQSGLFSGYFNILRNGNSEVINESSVYIFFKKHGDSFKVKGSGSNTDFGSFMLKGILKNGDLSVFKKYEDNIPNDFKPPSSLGSFGVLPATTGGPFAAQIGGATPSSWRPSQNRLTLKQAQQASTVSSSPSASIDLTEGWREVRDSLSRKSYFLNENTSEITWTKPTTPNLLLKMDIDKKRSASSTKDTIICFGANDSEPSTSTRSVKASATGSAIIIADDDDNDNAVHDINLQINGNERKRQHDVVDVLDVNASKFQKSVVFVDVLDDSDDDADVEILAHRQSSSSEYSQLDTCTVKKSEVPSECHKNVVPVSISLILSDGDET